MRIIHNPSIYYERIAFLDDNYSGTIGTIDDIVKLLEYENLFCGIGNNQSRGTIMARLQKTSYNVPVLIHPTAYVYPSAVIE